MLLIWSQVLIYRVKPNYSSIFEGGDGVDMNQRERERERTILGVEGAARPHRERRALRQSTARSLLLLDQARKQICLVVLGRGIAL